ncbi:MAG: hypothetical protein E6K78_01600 [Candidatus Eisenbacteria bacterium]|uniref:Uncharacterized protein n=1 Tax=Eiseniibacteriota bacterium TaxID=2212470 RepID=A0A538TXF1_UNCEI|nr:MAG: hypothetical protein E6K78_01600 [Candidatus Eisenbacteria bacterium]
MTRTWWTNALAPEGHLSGRQLWIATLIAATAAVFWGLVTRTPFVALVTFLTQVFFAWVTPSHRERALARIASAFLAGGMWAAIGMLLSGR